MPNLAYSLVALKLLKIVFDVGIGVERATVASVSVKTGIEEKFTSLEVFLMHIITSI